VTEYLIQVLKVLPFTLLYGAFLFSMTLLMIWVANIVSGDPLDLEDLKRSLRLSDERQSDTRSTFRPRLPRYRPQNGGHGPHLMWDPWVDG
jgi:hypothetical protein